MLLVASALLAGLLVVSGSAPSPATADANCDKYADPNGNDANSGNTPQQAKQSPIALLNALAPGQEGCLTDGATFTLDGGAAPYERAQPHDPVARPRESRGDARDPRTNARSRR